MWLILYLLYGAVLVGTMLEREKGRLVICIFWWPHLTFVFLLLPWISDCFFLYSSIGNDYILNLINS